MPPRTLADAAAARDNGFNLVRLAAALGVVVHHAYLLAPVSPGDDPVSRLLKPVTNLGLLMVAVFFLISGFFITRSWMHDPHLLRFAVRRAARILPGLIAMVLLTTVPAVLWFSSPGAGGLFSLPTWQYILGNVSLHGLRYAIPDTEWQIAGVLGGQSLNGSLWTLYWEGRMYVMVALLGVAAALPLRQWLMGTAAFLLLAASLFPDVAGNYIWEQRLWSMFLAGMLCCTLAARLRIGPVQAASACTLVALNFTRGADQAGNSFTWFGIALAAGAVALWAGSAQLRGWRHLRHHDYSYGLYLCHWPIMLMLKTALPQLAALQLLALSLLLAAPLAMLSWHYVEAPAMKMAQRWLAARRPAGESALRA
ncbi:acyltransferase [Massilia sp. Root418]|uniref:acyltransferase family protein n=1 Tax=Massilia sp. Root418 TaxID=1736532 RepID=UPI001E3B4C8E|nr:acyltransferase [Massilia sp. Root418]